MRQDLYGLIEAHPKFPELVRKRTRLGMLLSAIVLAAYLLFIISVAFAPGILGTPIAEGYVTTWGIPAGIFLIAGSFLLTGIYVRRANAEFDELNRDILRDTL